MNERIEEVLDQVLGMEEFEHVDEFLDTAFVKKFAELLIEDCGVALNPMLRDMISRGQALKLIKEHFGVEE
jgi:hypothetical protein